MRTENGEGGDDWWSGKHRDLSSLCSTIANIQQQCSIVPVAVTLSLRHCRHAAFLISALFTWHVSHLEQIAASCCLRLLTQFVSLDLGDSYCSRAVPAALLYTHLWYVCDVRVPLNLPVQGYRGYSRVYHLLVCIVMSNLV